MSILSLKRKRNVYVVKKKDRIFATKSQQYFSTLKFTNKENSNENDIEEVNKNMYRLYDKNHNTKSTEASEKIQFVTKDIKISNFYYNDSESPKALY